MESRSGKQVRERYINKLDPEINQEPFTQKEDKAIITYYHKIGAKWSKISEFMKGRPENMVKNRFYSHIKKHYDIKNICLKKSSRPTKTTRLKRKGAPLRGRRASKKKRVKRSRNASLKKKNLEKHQDALEHQLRALKKEFEMLQKNVYKEQISFGGPGLAAAQD